MSKWQFGYDIKMNKIEDEVPHAAEVGMDFIEFNFDGGENAFDTWDDDRLRAARKVAEDHGVVLAVHTTSGQNMAEFTPFYREAVEGYLTTTIENAAKLGCQFVIVHGGYHFGKVPPMHADAAVHHLNNASDLAEKLGVTLMLENHNLEPEHAELVYMPNDSKGIVWFLERLQSPAMKWSLNTGHANLNPEKLDGFLDLVGVERLGQLRINDNTGEYENHVPPGEGNIDFDHFFKRLKELDWQGPAILAFKPEEARLAWMEKAKKEYI